MNLLPSDNDFIIFHSSFIIQAEGRLVSLVLMIESLNVVHLVRCDGEVLILARGEEGILIVETVGLTIASNQMNYVQGLYHQNKGY